MKKIILLYLFLMSTIVNYAKVIEADTLIIRFFTWNVDDAPHLITCINYETDVPYREYKVTDISTINHLNDKIDSLHITQEQDFCVGCKLLCVKNGVVDNVICLNTKYIMINGNVYFCDKSIVDIIDTLTNSISPSLEKFDYIPERFGAEYSKGKCELYKILSSYYKKIKQKYCVNGITMFEIFCKADKSGRTNVANVKLYNKNVNSEDKIKIAESVKDFFLRKIRWKKNNTRMNADWIKVYYKSSDN